MPNHGANRDWAIIGVVGKSGVIRPNMTPEQLDKGNQLLSDARSVGKAIAKKGLAVLTGGHHGHPEESVKYYALLGAVDVVKDLKCVRLIGVVPISISRELREPEVRVETPDAPEKLRYAYVHTQLRRSKERDPITGQIADVLIALWGESGTPREVAAALIAGRPVVFYNSLLALERGVIIELNKAKEKWKKTAEDFNLQPHTPESVEKAVERALAALAAYGHGTSSQEPQVATSAEVALEMALSAIEYGTPSQRLRGCYPTMEPDLREDFDRALSKMEC